MTSTFYLCQRSLDQGLANFFCKVPESKYFRLCGPYSLYCIFFSVFYAKPFNNVKTILSVLNLACVPYFVGSCSPRMVQRGWARDIRQGLSPQRTDGAWLLQLRRYDLSLEMKANSC